MSDHIELEEGMRVGIPFRAQSSIRIDTDRFEEYPFSFPEQSGVTKITTANCVADLSGHYGKAIAEVSCINTSDSGYQYISLKILSAEIAGDLSATRGERANGMKYKSNLNKYGYDTAGPSSTVSRLNRGL